MRPDAMAESPSQRAALATHPGSPDRLLVGDEDIIICEACITLAVARIAEARGDFEKGGSVPQSAVRAPSMLVHESRDIGGASP
jgi:hypothetical protein